MPTYCDIGAARRQRRIVLIVAAVILASPAAAVAQRSQSWPTNSWPSEQGWHIDDGTPMTTFEPFPAPQELSFGSEMIAPGSAVPAESTWPLDLESVPTRPEPVLELGNPFLGNGPIMPGIEMPGGAVWQPSFLLFGTYRTAVQVYDDGQTTFGDWTNRLDLYGNLQLTGTERVLVGIRPLDEDGDFAGYYLRPRQNDGWHDPFNIELNTLFFEGEIGELIPNVDPRDFGSLDLGFSAGRQPLFYQEGLLVNDNVDAIGIIRDNLILPGGSDLQIAVVYGWHDIHRENRITTSGLRLFGLFSELDCRKAKVNADFVYVDDEKGGNDSAHWGISSVQRFGHYNTALHVLGSHALDGESIAITTGYLAFGTASWGIPHTKDYMYVNAFCGIDRFSSAARQPTVGGPLGRIGLTFAAQGLGQYGSPLSNRADKAVGGSLGYQFILDDYRRHIIFEVGARQSTATNGDGQIAGAVSHRQAYGQHWIVQIDGFGTIQESANEGFGTRIEVRCEF